MPKAADITRQWYVVDAEGQVFGRVASQVANILRGKNKPIYTPNVDTGDYVIITYSDVSFPEFYHLIKSIQPNCLVMDLNGAKYPSEALFYSDIRCYEQGAGQKISPETNQLPAMACYPLQKTWFWKTEFPGSPLKDVDKIVAENIIPYNNAYCTYILNFPQAYQQVHQAI